MSYLIAQIAFLLLLAAVLGGLAGWLGRSLAAQRELAKSEAGHRHRIDSLSLEISSLRMALDRYRQHESSWDETQDLGS